MIILLRTVDPVQIQQILKEEKERHHSVIDNLENDYNQNRKAYVKEILERIIEV